MPRGREPWGRTGAGSPELLRCTPAPARAPPSTLVRARSRTQREGVGSPPGNLWKGGGRLTQLGSPTRGAPPPEAPRTGPAPPASSPPEAGHTVHGHTAARVCAELGLQQAQPVVHHLAGRGRPVVKRPVLHTEAACEGPRPSGGWTGRAQASRPWAPTRSGHRGPVLARARRGQGAEGLCWRGPGPGQNSAGWGWEGKVPCGPLLLTPPSPPQDTFWNMLPFSPERPTLHQAMVTLGHSLTLAGLTASGSADTGVWCTNVADTCLSVPPGR